MKATGVVRKIDVLGRIVIPKEIRRTLKIKEGTPLEIYTGDGNELVLKKYSPLMEFNKLAKDIVESLHATTNKNVLVSNTESVIAFSGTRPQDYINKLIDSRLEHLIRAKQMQIVSMQQERTMLLPSNVKSYLVCPILSNGDVVGGFVMFDEYDGINDADKAVLASFADYLSRQIG